VRGRHVSRRCFVRGRHHLILPAFGALTGGMAAHDPAIEAYVGGPAEAIIGLKDKPVRFPLPFADRVIEKVDDPQFALPLASTGQ
jgi:metallophosphoesterase superfamily enzyme